MYLNVLYTIVDFFIPPKKRFADIFEEANYILTYRILVFLQLCLITLIPFIIFSQEFQVIVVNIFSLLLTFVTTLFVRKTTKIKSITAILNLIGCILVLYTLFFIPTQPHVIFILWMVINIVFAYVTINLLWGTIFTVIHSISLFLYYFFIFESHRSFLLEITEMQLLGIAINALICLMIIAYLIYANIKTNQQAQIQLNQAQEALTIQLSTIQKQSREKTILLKEIHHRVKNNLQIITSLIRLQSRELENEEAVSTFRDLTNRVLTMSMIHERMYKTESFDSLNVESYLKELAQDLCSSHSMYSIKIHIETEIVDFGLNTIVPLALIFNELFTNSIKHAFQDIDDQHIYISFKKYNQKTYLFEFKDNGNWKTPEKSESFGFELIQALVEQLDGEIKFESTPNTKYMITFKLQD
jgi:two-component system, sensor histidine kinase PdtaS